jgi:hypothetical protein
MTISSLKYKLQVLQTFSPSWREGEAMDFLFENTHAFFFKKPNISETQ